MRFLSLIFSFLICVSVMTAQNPYEQFGVQGKTLQTASEKQGGRIFEVVNKDTNSEIKTLLFNFDAMQYVALDSCDHVIQSGKILAEVPKKWLSRDPLESSFPSKSPYNFVSNNPISRIDPDGRADYYANGNWTANDGVKDDKVYHSNPNGSKTFGLGVLKDTKFEEWTYEIKDSKFKEYFPILLKHEGGYVNDPVDRGGATNRGVTYRTFSKYAKRHLKINSTLENLKRLSKSQAAIIYEKEYWKKYGADKINDKKLSWLYFDTYMHGGGRTVFKETMQELGEDNRKIDRLNVCMEEHTARIIFEIFKTKRLERFERIIKKRPSQAKYRRGWNNRVNKFDYD